MTRSTFVGSILGYVGGLGPHFCRGVPWSPDIVPYKTGEQPTTLNAQGDINGSFKVNLASMTLKLLKRLAIHRINRGYSNQPLAPQVLLHLAVVQLRQHRARTLRISAFHRSWKLLGELG